MPIGLSSSFSSNSAHYDPIITWEKTFIENNVFVVPEGVFEIGAVCIGGGGGGAGTTQGGGGGYGGDLRWARSIPVVPGESLTITVGTGGAGGTTTGIAGTFSKIRRNSTDLLVAAGGREGSNVDDGSSSKPAKRAKNATTGTSTAISLPLIGGGDGGQGGWEEKGAQAGGGGGAGGYSGDGGIGGDADEGETQLTLTGSKIDPAPGWSGLGGAGGGGGTGTSVAGGGGGVGLLGSSVTYPVLTSSSSVGIGTGNKIFTVSSTTIYRVGMRVRISSRANSANFINGYISAITPTQITVVSQSPVGGSGTYSDWNITITGIFGSNGVLTGNGVGGLGGTNGGRGGGGSGGQGGTNTSEGALYGGGGGATDTSAAGGPGSQGAVRLIWGRNRYYPTANVRNIPKFPAGTSVEPTIQKFTTPGETNWTVPDGVTSINVLTVGGGGGAVTGNTELAFAAGGGGGGGLGYGNNIPVTPGETLKVTVGAGGASVNNSSPRDVIYGGTGGTSSVTRDSTVLVGATGGLGGESGYGQELLEFLGGSGGAGTGTALTQGFSGGRGGNSVSPNDADATRFGGAGGGGAAGYRGNGGNGSHAISTAGFSGVISSTSNSIGTGSKTFVVNSASLYVVGTRVRVFRTGQQTTFVEGLITDITVGSTISITVLADTTSGSGTYNTWRFLLAEGTAAIGRGYSPSANSGAGGGGGAGSTDTTAGAGGGGVGINGAGLSGTGGAINVGGTGGSGGANGQSLVNGVRNGGLYGGGAGAGADRPPTSGAYTCAGGQGAVVIAYGMSDFYPNGTL
jgi:hypothetical protein